MTPIHKSWQYFGAQLAILAFGTQLILPYQAYASMNATDDASSLSPSSIKAQPPSCDDICPLLVGQGGTNTSQGSGQGLNGTDGSCNTTDGSVSLGDPSHVNQSVFTSCTVGLGGGAGWTSTDDQECASRGFPTDVSAQPTSSPTPVVSASGAPSKCNVPMLSTDAGNCQTANQKALKCMLHGSQLEAQCLAYEADSQGNSFDTIMLALDLAVVALCTTACFAKATAFLGAASEIACKWGSLGVGATEMITSLLMNSSPVGKTIGALLGAAGGAVGFLGAGAANVGSFAGQNQIVGAGGTGDMSINGVSSTDDTVQDGESCITAIIFAVMAGIRVYDITQMGKSKSDACNAVQSLWSSSTAQGTGAGTTQNPGQYLFNPQTGQVTAGGPPGAGGGQGTIGNSPPGTQQCTNGPCPTIPPGGQTTSAATDAGFLRNSGLDNKAAPIAQQMLDHGLGNMKSAGQAAQAALGGGLGDFGSALAQLAQESQDHATELPGVSGMGTFSAGGGGGGGGKSGGGDNPFASLFGGAGGKDAGHRGPAAETFGKAPVNDIWHTGTTMNLFEIISGKIEKVASRVR